MAKDKGASPVDDTVEPADAAATAAAPEASQDAGEGSGGSGVISEAEVAVEEIVAEVREELSDVGQAVMSWCNEHFGNSPISRATEALNYLREHAVPDLIKRIERI